MFFNVRRFSKILLIIAFTSLIGFIQPIYADLTTTPLGYPGEQEYKAYLQVVVRDKNNQLVSVTESINTWRVPTLFPDGVPAPLWINTVFFNTIKENYQTVIINDVKYEKVQYYLEYENDRADSYLYLCTNMKVYGNICIKSFYARAPMVYLEEGDVLTEQWSILRLIS